MGSGGKAAGEEMIRHIGASYGKPCHCGNGRPAFPELSEALPVSKCDPFLAIPILFAVILIAVAALFGVKIFLIKKAYFKAWFASAITIAGCTFFGVIGLFPNMFPSSIDTAYSLTAHNASSSELTLKIMLVVVAIFVPAVIAYQVWTYHFFKGKVTEEDIIY